MPLERHRDAAVPVAAGAGRYHPHVPGAILLTTLGRLLRGLPLPGRLPLIRPLALPLLGALMLLSACTPAAQPVPTPTPAPRQSSATTLSPNRLAPPKPTASPAARARTTASPVAASSGRPAASPVPSGTATGPERASTHRTSRCQPTCAGGDLRGRLPRPGPSPDVSAASRGAAPPDDLGIAASANAAANAADGDAVALCGAGAVLSTHRRPGGWPSGDHRDPARGSVVSGGMRGQPTFLNDAPYPNHVFTAVVWGRDRGSSNPRWSRSRASHSA